MEVVNGSWQISKFSQRITRLIYPNHWRWAMPELMIMVIDHYWLSPKPEIFILATAF